MISHRFWQRRFGAATDVITSQGMLLAAGEPPNLTVVTVGDSIAPGTRVK